MKRFVGLIVGIVVWIASVRAQSYTFTTGPTAYYANGIVLADNGDVYVTNQYWAVVQRITPTGTATTIAGNGIAGALDGIGTAARFNQPMGLAADNAGNLYVADSGNHTIRKVTLEGLVSTFAGSSGLPGSVDGSALQARFNQPTALAFDASGNLYVGDVGNQTIRKITPAGVVTTLAGSAGVKGTADGTGAAARFNGPVSLCVDATGNVFVADKSNHAIRKITPSGVVTTLAGLAGNAGYVDGPGADARFEWPQCVAIDPAGGLFVSDGIGRVRRISASGVVSTIGVTSDYWGGVSAMVADADGTLRYSTGQHLGTALPSAVAAITRQPSSGSIATGSTLRLSVTATGAAPLSFQWQKDGVVVPGATTATYLVASAKPSDAGAYTVSVANGTNIALSDVARVEIAPALPNDDFANAQTLSGQSGAAAGTDIGATGEVGEPTHGNFAVTQSSVWYRWTPAVSGTAIFQAVSNSFNIAVYQGADLRGLTPIAVSEYATNVSFFATAGQTYRIAVGSTGSYRGEFQLKWHMIINDQFAFPTDLVGDQGQMTTQIYGSSVEPGEPAHVNANADSVWYLWTPTQSGVAVFTAFIGATYFEAYTGDALGDLRRVGVSSRAPISVTFMTFLVSAGHTYRLAATGGDDNVAWRIVTAPFVTSFGSNPSSPADNAVAPRRIDSSVFAGASLNLSVTALSATPMTYQWSKDGVDIPDATGSTLQIAHATTADAGNYAVVIRNGAGVTEPYVDSIVVLVPPANDNFANATALTGPTGTVSGDNTNASAELQEPINWNTYGTNSSVWYRWTAPFAGLAVFDTVGSKIDTVLTVFTGAELRQLSRVTQDDDHGGAGASRVSFSAKPGTTYYIAIGGATQAARGAISLNWQLDAALAIVTPPASQTVAIGGSATFMVNATGAGATYQWLRNGTAIPGATDATLTLGSIQPGDDASYSVAVTNSTGTVVSAPASLAVAAPQDVRLTQRSFTPQSEMLWGIANSADTLVTVGANGMILASSDGQAWQPRYTGTNAWLVGVTYGGGQFVAVGEKGTILLSRDGYTWTSVTAPTSQRLNNVVYASGKYVAVGEAGTILTSTDGVVWQTVQSGVTGWLHGLAYNADIGTFATAGEGGTLLYSADGLNWSQLPVTGVTEDLEALTAVGSYAQFVAIGASGKVVAVRQNSLVFKTGDKLVTWSTDVSSAGTALRFRGLTQGASALFASGEEGKVITAADASSPWFTIASGTTANLLAGTYFNHRLYLVGENRTVLESNELYSSRLMNLSTRCSVGTGDATLISGFVVTGSAPKRVLIRAAGPAIGVAPFNVSGVIAAPVLKLFDAQSRPLLSNTGWGTAANATDIRTTAAAVGAFPFAEASADSAILTTLDPGQYTTQVSGANGTTGVTILEVYDVDSLSTQTAQAINLSSRGIAGSGDQKLIVGFVIDGASSRRVLIRAVGPGLAGAPFNIAGTLPEPRLELYNSRSHLQASAGAWGLQTNADEIRGVSKSLGAFALPDGSKDSAMLVTLLPGSWTVQVGAPAGTSGVVIAEIYVLP